MGKNLVLAFLVLGASSSAFADSGTAKSTQVLDIHYSLPERAESSPSSPPLETDDPGTPGTHRVELNFIVDCDSVRDGRSCQSGIDAAFGVGEKMQIRVSKYVVEEKQDGEKTFRGLGHTSIGVKYRFYDRNGLQLAVFPSYQFDDATRQRNSDGTLAESDGRTLYLPIIISKDLGDKWTVVGNVGYTKNLDHANSDSTFKAIGIGRSLGPNMRAMAEFTSSTSQAGTRNDIRVGLIRAIRENLDFFISAGKSIKAEDKKAHTMVRLGLSVKFRNPT